MAYGKHLCSLTKWAICPTSSPTLQYCFLHACIEFANMAYLLDSTVGTVVCQSFLFLVSVNPQNNMHTSCCKDPCHITVVGFLHRLICSKTQMSVR